MPTATAATAADAEGRLTKVLVGVALRVDTIVQVMGLGLGGPLPLLQQVHDLLPRSVSFEDTVGIVPWLSIAAADTPSTASPVRMAVLKQLALCNWSYGSLLLRAIGSSDRLWQKGTRALRLLLLLLLLLLQLLEPLLVQHLLVGLSLLPSTLRHPLQGFGGH